MDLKYKKYMIKASVQNEIVKKKTMKIYVATGADWHDNSYQANICEKGP